MVLLPQLIIGSTFPPEVGSAMAMHRFDRKRIYTALMFTLFLTITSWSISIPPTENLDDSREPGFVVVSNGATADTALNGSAPNNNYGTSDSMMLANMGMIVSRGLLSFNMTDQNGNSMPLNNLIHAATLRIKCTQFSFAGSGRTVYYAAAMATNWSESSATWNRAFNGGNWSEPGADGQADRHTWEPPTTLTGNGWISLNVTRLAQQAQRDNTSEVHLILSVLGLPVSCVTSDSTTAADRPDLQVSYSTVGNTTRGAVTIASPENGEVLMELDLNLTADLSPNITWADLNGSGVEIQFSADDSYQSFVDGGWHWTSWGSSSAFTLATNGSFETPGATNLSEGLMISLRMRSNKNDVVGDWQEIQFGLPDIDSTIELDGSYSFTMTNGSLGLGRGAMLDTYVRSGNTSYSGSSDGNMYVGHSNTTNISDSHMLMDIAWGDVGMHDNATIINAELILRRTNRNGEPVISVAPFDSPSWDAATANWTASGSGSAWSDGGLGFVGQSLGALDGNQSAPQLKFDLTTMLQERMRAGTNSDFGLIVRGVGNAGEYALIGSAEEAAEYHPILEINYKWGNGSVAATIADVTPRDGSGSWDRADGNLTRTTTPIISWNYSGHSSDEIIIQLSGDADFNSTITRVADSREDSGFTLGSGEFSVPASWALEIGARYWWRIQWVEDGVRGDWENRSMLVTEHNSSALGDDEYLFSLRHGNASSIIDAPFCKDTYIDSGNNNANENGNNLNVGTTQAILVACELDGHLLPSGLAVISASLKMRTDLFGSSSNVLVSIHENSQHRWTEDGATWSDYDGTNSWNGAGASGAERVTTLDSITVSTAGNWYEWNVTSAVQKAMRWGSDADFILTSNGAATFYDRESSGPSAQNWPILEIKYTQGSDDSPAIPTGLSPDNGQWMVEDSVLMSGITQPLMSWTTDASLAHAVEIQLDTSTAMNTANLQNYQSWTDTSAFDLSAGEFSQPSALSDGQIWYWRVRGLSETGQLGNWSSIAWFRLPDVVSSMLTSDTSEVEMRHHEWLPSENVPIFYDTWVDYGSAGLNDTHAGATTLFVGRANSTESKDALIALPIAENLTLPHPTDVNIVAVSLHVYVTNTNGTQPTLTSHRAVNGFNGSANGTTYDGVNNWSSLTGGNNVGRITDIVEVTSTGWQEFIITEIVQEAIRDGEDFAYIQFLADPNGVGQAEIISTEHSSTSLRPYVTFAMRNGTAESPAGMTNLTLPADGEVTWNENGHVLEADRTPTMTWSSPNWNNSWDWRVFFWVDVDDELAGWTLHDSRVDASNFDLTVPSFTAPSLSVNQRFRWFVQPVYESMLGERSDTRYFDVPYNLNWRTNSTDGVFEAQRGSAVTATETYDLMEAGAIDSDSPNSLYSNLYVGRSAGTSAIGPHTNSFVRVDVGQIPIPEPWQVLDAKIQMYKSSTASNSLNISVVPVLRDWNESNLTWNQFDTNQSWQVAGAGGSADIGAVLDTQTVSTQGWYEWDVTAAMQQARVRGDDTLSLMFTVFGEDPISVITFDNEMRTTNREQRPILNVSYRIGAQWVPADPTGLNPATATTLWDTSSVRPLPVSAVMLDWNHSASNASWQLEVSTNPDFSSDVALLDSTISTSSGSFGSTDFLFYSSTAWADSWYHWRLRSVDGTRIGNWTDGGSFRVPTSASSIGSDDAAGNHTITLRRGAIFSDSGLLPSFPDTYIDSATPFGVTRNHGSNERMAVGNSPDTSGADAVSLLDLDLGELPFPSTILPTSVTLKLYRGSYDGTGAHSVAIHDCFGNTWTESSITWSNYNPTTQCNSTASSSITKVATGSGEWYEWDVTVLAREAFTSNNGRLTIAVMSNWSGTLWFASAENQTSGFAPQLQMDFIDNPNGTTPPGQATLISPGNLEVLYGASGMLLSSSVRPTLIWNAVPGATGYSLRLKADSDVPIEYQNWSASTGQGFSANGTTWTPTSDLNLQTLYTWDVRAISGSVPGPRSSSWSFALGDPTTSDLGNHVYQAYYAEGNDADVLSYPQVHDASIDESEPSATRGSSSLRVGIGCGSLVNNMDECRGLYSLDLGQLPLSSDVNSHSAQLRIWLNQVPTADASYMDLSVHRLLNNNFDETGATWQSASFGNAWNSAGMTAGVDYDSTPLDTVRIYVTTNSGWLEFDVSDGLPVIDGTIQLVLIGTPNNGRMVVDLAHSEDSTSSHHPELLFNYTTVDDIQITGPSTTDADSSVSFSAQMLDAQGGSLSGTVYWEASAGSIAQTGIYTPDVSGVISISAQYGQVTKILNLTVTPGNPVTLVTTPDTAGITTDENVSLTAEVHDQHGNAVAGEMVFWTATNGSFSTTGTDMTSATTPVAAFTWAPWLSGTQNITVTWGVSSALIPVVITVGTPDYLEIQGCATVAAAENCTYTWTVHDWRGNLANPGLAETVTWSVNDGNISQSGFFVADHVGTQSINASSSTGIEGSFTVQVAHGEIQSIELTAANNSITADDSVSFVTVRIDIRGNRLPVDLTAEEWSVSNGTMVPGEFPVWTAWKKGQQWVEASIEGVSSRVYITVSDGAPIALDIRVRDDGTNAVAGETRTVDGYTVDQRGNQRPVALESWSLLENDADPEWLDDYLTNAIFNARSEGSWTIRGLYLWTTDDGSFSLHDDLVINVTAGSLADVQFDAVTWQLTADDEISIQVTTEDAYGNSVPANGLSWWMHDISISIAPADCGVSSDSVLLNGSNAAGVFSHPASMIGEFVICAAQNGYEARGTATISVGTAVEIWHDAASNSTVAGAILDIALWAHDSDNNTFRIEVEGLDGTGWLVGSEDGEYRYAGTVAGIFTHEYNAGALTGLWEVTIFADDLNRFELSLSKTSAEQLETVVLTATGYDEYDNIVPVPNAQVMAIGHDVEAGAAEQTWNIRLIEVGSTTVQVSSSGITQQIDVSVVGNVAGFFEAGGPIVYAGVGVVVLVLLVAVVLAVVILRRGSDDDWAEELEDEYDDEYEDDDVGVGPSAPSAGPMTAPSAAPVAGPSGPSMAPAAAAQFEPEPEYHEEAAADDGVTTDEDGTDWWEDEDGVWWYRTPEMEDWEEYIE
jgi:hypothetical protein